jgi:Tfp pilus assembly PilM family ATPase
MPIDDLDGDSEIIVEARNVLTDGVRRIADDVRNSIDFHAMQEGAAEVEQAVLTGPAVAIPGFSDHLAEQLAVPVEVGVVSEGRAGGLGSGDAGTLAIAAGLTVEAIT